MISWIMATRNDGYGGECPGVDNFTMRRLELTIDSIRALEKEYNVPMEVIVVDFCTPEDRVRVKKFTFTNGCKIVEIQPDYLSVVQTDSVNHLPFYEYLAKHAGISHATQPYIIACNPDNIFLPQGFDYVIQDLKEGKVVRAIRVEIDRKYALMPFEQFKRDCKTIAGIAYPSAAGDFTGLARHIYHQSGGYRLVHGSWHVDNEFIERLIYQGHKVAQGYIHAHLNHDNAVVENITSHDWRNFQPISQGVIDLLPEFTKVYQ